MGFLVRNNLLDLTSPVDDRRLKALNELFVLHGCVGISDVLVRDVELRLALHVGRFLRQSGHELVQISLEGLLYAFGPVSFLMNLGHIVIRHLGEQVVKRVIVDLADHDLVLNGADVDRLLATALNEEGHLVLLGTDVRL